MFVNLDAFVGLSLAVIVSPGPDTALTIRNTLSGGRLGGLGTAAGVATGQAVWTGLSAAGIAALVLASPVAFGAVRVAGAVYLFALGAQSVRSALASRVHRRTVDGQRPRVHHASGRSFRQGLVSNLGNPKMAVFFTGLLPVFVESPGVVPLALLGLTFCAMTLGWLALYAVVVSRAGDWLAGPRIRPALELATGAALIVLALVVVADGLQARQSHATTAQSSVSSW